MIVITDTVWTKNATITLLSLYEANLHKIDHKNKKTKLWNAISESLHAFDIKVHYFITHIQTFYILHELKQRDLINVGSFIIDVTRPSEMENKCSYKKIQRVCRQ